MSSISRLPKVRIKPSRSQAMILPGIVDGIRLHPYEYIYYNRFIGGVDGAQGLSANVKEVGDPLRIRVLGAIVRKGEILNIGDRGD